MATRDSMASAADHTRVSAIPSDIAAVAGQVQTAAVSVRESTFFGRADMLGMDTRIFADLVASNSHEDIMSPVSRPPLAEGAAQSVFAGQQFVASAPKPPTNRRPRRNAASDRNVFGGSRDQTVQRPSRQPEDVDGTPQITSAKPPAKPFYIGLVDVPGIGYANTLLSRNATGEFDPTRKASEALVAQPLSRPESSQTRSLTPAVVKLHVNPTDITMTYQKKVTPTRVRANYARRELAQGGKVTGFTVEHHWDELDNVSVNCVTGNFWVNGGMHYPRGEQSGFVSSRSKSLAYRKLQSVIAMFRNNGCAWLSGNTKLTYSDEENFFGSDYNIIVNPGSAFMMYDNIIWYGHFETMSVTESGDMPNAFQFSLDFKVAKTIDLNGVSDADVLEGSWANTPSFFTEPPKQTPVSDQRSNAENLEKFKQDALREAESRTKAAEVLGGSTDDEIAKQEGEDKKAAQEAETAVKKSAETAVTYSRQRWAAEEGG